MKRIVILGLLCLILLAACVSPSAEILDEEMVTVLVCQQLTSITRACEFYLLDGTHCVMAYMNNSDGGVSLTCNWK